jgi:hypothetical protein
MMGQKGHAKGVWRVWRWDAYYDSVSGLESPLKTDLEIQHLLWPLICHVKISHPLDITPESTDAAEMDR